MKKIWNCRRSMLALIGMAMTLIMGLYLKIDTSGAIAMMAMGVAASNAAQAAVNKKRADVSSESPKE